MRCQGYRLYLFIASFFVVIGLSFVIVGVVIGLDLTSGVEKQLQDRYCIDSKDHPDYSKWANPPPYQTLLYFWEVLNGDDVLYNSKIPKVAERGPYVYKTTARKIDVVFDKQGRVTYKEFLQQEFDKNATKQRCPDCNEDNKLTVVNQKFFELLHIMQWDTRVASFFIPGVLKRFLLEMDNKTGGRNATYARIGRFQPSPMPSTHPTFSFEFGQFIMKNMAIFPQIQVPVIQKGRDYNETEMRGLYEAFIDPTFQSLADGYSFYRCYSSFRPYKCGIPIYLYHYGRIQMLKQSGKFSQEEAEAMESDSKELNSLISGILCPSKTQCFPFNSDSFLLLTLFFGQSLLPLAMANSIEKSYVFTRRSQKELAFGYIDPHYPLFPRYPDGIPVSGYLVHDVNASATRKRGEMKSFYTCSASQDKSFIWAEYRDHTRIFTSGVETPFVIIKGYDKQLPPASKISLCQNDFKENHNTLKLFLPELYQDNELYFAGMNNPSGNSIPNMRFNLDITERGNVTFNGSLLDDVRVKDVSVINGFLSVASLPYFVDSRRNFRRRHNISDPDIESSRCYVDFEPLTGQIVAAKIRSQISAALTKSNIIKNFNGRPRPIKLGYTNPAWPGGFKYIPVYWTEKTWAIDQSEIAKFYQSLEIACQITVYLPTAGGIFILAAVIMLVLVIKHRGNSAAAVQPQEPEKAVA